MSANTVKPMILSNTSSFIVRYLKLSGTFFFIKTERTIIIDKKVALFLAC